MEPGGLARYISRPIRITVAVVSAAGAIAFFISGDEISAFWTAVLSAVFTWSSIAPRRIPEKRSEAFLEELRRESIGVAIAGVAFLLLAVAVLFEWIPSRGSPGIAAILFIVTGGLCLFLFLKIRAYIRGAPGDR